MVFPATVSQMGFLRRVICDGAAAGAFDTELLADSPSSRFFFRNLEKMLVSGTFAAEDPRTGALNLVNAVGYVMCQDLDSGPGEPVGFGLFKATPIGFELWLMGIAAEYRGRGLGCNLLLSLLATREGHDCFFARVSKNSAYFDAMDHLLGSGGFAPARVTTDTVWYLRHDAPADIAARFAAAPVIRLH